MVIVLIIIGCLILGFFAGIIFQKRNAHYDGKIIVAKIDEKTVYTLELDGDPDEIKNKRSISFKVVPQGSDLAE